MALRDYVVQNLRSLLGVDRDEIAKAESPSAEAARRFPTVFSMAGREDLHGALNITNSLQEIFADYEAMYDYPDIRTALWYFASDATQPNIDNGRVLWVTSHDAAIAGSANNMIQQRLRLEEEMFPYAFELCWMGNGYLEPLITENGVVGLNSLPPVTMRRIEMPNGGLVGYVQDITCRFTANQAFLRQAVAGAQDLPENVVTFEDWQIIHFRLRSHSPRATYGKSVADAARWLWRRIVMLDDMIMMNRLTRIPRYAYYVDVTDVPPAKRDAALRQAKQDLRKKQSIDPRTGRMDSRYNVAALDEDLFFAVTQERPLSRVEVVAAPDVITTTDAEFFKRMLHGSLMVPRAYMGQDAPIAGRAVLSSEDVRAARVTLTVQKELRQGVERLIRIDQAARGYPNPQSTKFEVNMTVPSGIYELAQLEVRSARADFAARIEPYMSMRWIREHVFKLNDEEIAAIEAQRKQEALALLPPEMQGQEGPPQPEFVTPESLPQSTDARLDTLLGRKPTAAESRGWDRTRRLEEDRDRKSRQNHQLLIDKMNMSLQRDEALARRVDQAVGLVNDLRGAALRTNANGRVQALPSGRGRRPQTI